jgi:signal transduction histidine kinase
MENIHILLVDDEEEVLETMATILEMDNYTISTALSGRQALNVIEKNLNTDNPVDILVTDIAMPGLSGIELIDEVQNSGLELPILAVTGFGTKSKLVELIQKGIVGYIEKPFIMEELLRRVKIVAEKVQKKKNKQKATEETLLDTRNRVKTLEEQLLQTQEFEILGKLASGIMHDFNNMLTAISGYADLIIEEPVDNDNPASTVDQIQYFGAQIIKATITAQNTIRQMQAFAKHDEQEFCHLNIHEVIREAIKIINGTIGKDVTVLTEFNAADPYIHGERTLLHNTLINLFINARDAMPGGGRLTIRTNESPERKNLVVTIKDTGVGMDDSIKKRVFEPFFTTKGKKGNGLGLAGVLSAVDRHNGKIECDSIPDKGTEFRLLFPIVKKDELDTVSELSSQKT